MKPPLESRPPDRPGDHWQRHAGHWDRVGPPLRPSPEDVGFAEEALARRHGQAGAAFRALLLGVTPELALMRWPRNTSLLAVDRSAPMIRHVWPRSGFRATASAVCGLWEHLPVKAGSMDAVLGDGFHAQLAFPAGYLRLGEEIHRVLRPRGLYVMRTFARPRQPESTDDVRDALWAGAIGNFHIFKLRLAMALHGSIDQGVRLGDVWDTWRTFAPNAAELAAALRWPPEQVATIDAYRGSNTRYTFPTLGELREIFAAHFIEIECQLPCYELGDRCPTLVLASK